MGPVVTKTNSRLGDEVVWRDHHGAPAVDKGRIIDIGSCWYTVEWVSPEVPYSYNYYYSTEDRIFLAMNGLERAIKKAREV
jgi:hypothetical protein